MENVWFLNYWLTVCLALLYYDRHQQSWAYDSLLRKLDVVIWRRSVLGCWRYHGQALDFAIHAALCFQLWLPTYSQQWNYCVCYRSAFYWQRSRYELHISFPPRCRRPFRILRLQRHFQTESCMKWHTQNRYLVKKT